MTELANLKIELEEIPNLDFSQLRSLYHHLYQNQPLKSTRRQFYVWRVTYRLQELRYGGLDKKTKTLLENMDFSSISERSVTNGIEITKKYKGKLYKIRSVGGGFEMDGEFYKSLSAVAYKITGRRISGKVFLGV